MKYYCIYLKLASHLHVFVNNDKYSGKISLILPVWAVLPFLLRMRAYLQALCCDMGSAARHNEGYVIHSRSLRFP